MTDLIRFLKDGTISEVLENVGKIASVFNPALGSGLMLASNITDNTKGVNDDFLENDVIGLSGTSARIRKMVNDRHYDAELLIALCDNLDSMSEFVQKTSKLIK